MKYNLRLKTNILSCSAAISRIVFAYINNIILCINIKVYSFIIRSVLICTHLFKEDKPQRYVCFVIDTIDYVYVVYSIYGFVG